MRVDRKAGGVVCENCLIADTMRTRMRGLLGRAALRRDEGLLIRPAGSIHTFFMRFALDAVFLDRDLRVVGIAAELKPWRIAGRRRAKAVLELRAGEAAQRGVAPGDELVLTEEQADKRAEG